MVVKFLTKLVGCAKKKKSKVKKERLLKISSM
jgi:hypothetical protein